MPRAALHQYLGLTDTTLVTPHRVIRSHKAFRTADVVNLHNMHGCYWNFWTLPALARRKSVVLTLHDEWFLTGDCVYTYDCTAWQGSCGKCPQMKWSFRPNLGGRDATSFNLRLKRWAARLTPADQVVLVSPSEWLAGQIRKAPHLTKFHVEVIPYGIDGTEFSPRDKAAAKAHFGLPADRFCFLIFANNLNDPRKGANLLVRTVKQYGLPRDSIELMVGNRPEETASQLQSQGVTVYFRPYIRERDEICRCLSAADCVLLFSAADNLPYAGLEAISCGCPVLARRIGGIPEIVREGESGFLLPSNPTEQEVFGQMQQIARLTVAERQCVGERGRQFAVQRFSLNRFLDTYESLFARLMDARQTRFFTGKVRVRAARRL
jgi:glycosyltransferase involved in cell wall biosynthesis